MARERRWYLKIDLKWERPFRLKDGSRLNLIYSCTGLDRIRSKPGVYVFARRFSKSKLMMGLKKARSGHRILLVARLSLHPGQQKKKVLDIIESALIKHALAQGHDLLNQQGTKTKVHTLKSKGNSSSRYVAPLTMLVERKKNK